jgi:hypothetical protein
MTRRKFCQTTATLALAATVLDLPSLSPFPGKAFAETVPAEELMKPGTLPEMAMGDEKAPVTVIEYASMTCSHCARFQEATFPELKKRYIDTGKVRYIFREFPLDSLAAAAFMLARCAGKDDKDKYFALVDTLFRQQRQWTVEKPIPPLLAIAKQAGFTGDVQCLPRESADARRHRKHPPAGDQAVQGAVDADIFYQWNGSSRRTFHRRNGQGDRPLSQGLIRVFWLGRTPVGRGFTRRLAVACPKGLENRSCRHAGQLRLCERGDSFLRPTRQTGSQTRPSPGMAC